MKKFIFFTLYLLLCVFLYSNIDNNNIDTKFRNLLTDFGNFMQNNTNNDLYNKFEFVKNKTLNQEVFFAIDYKSKHNIFGVAGFSPKGFNNYKNNYFFINAYLIDLYSEQPSIVFSILIHEFIHAYNYFNNIYINNDNVSLKGIDFYLNEVDALKWEAYFVENYLKPNSYLLTKFENFLIENINNNENLASNCYYFDYQTLLKLYTIKYSNDFNIEQRLHDLENLGNDIILNNKIEYSDTNEIKYKKIMKFYTFNNFSNEVIKYLVKKYQLKFSNKYLLNIRNIIFTMNSVLTFNNLKFSKTFYNDFLVSYNK